MSEVSRDRVRKGVLLAITLAISAVFFWMVRGFLLTLLLAGIFAALARPIYRRMESLSRGRRSLAAITTVLFVILAILLPLLSLFGIVTAQAIKVSESVRPWVQTYFDNPDVIDGFLQGSPLYEKVRPVLDLVVQKAGELISGMSRFLVTRLSSVAGATVQAFFHAFVLFYAMFFFLRDGEGMLRKILHYLPLEDRDEKVLLARFTSVARATLKGTLVIGVMQGGLAGLAFALAGIPSAVFWGTVMTVFSVIPGIGTALVWVPAAFILALEGSYGRAAGLTVFCLVVVGSIDNVLRPRLVGQDTKMHELTVFLGTVGGIILFGVAGFIIGPIVAALFVTTWEIAGDTFRELLPEVGAAAPGQAGKNTEGEREVR